MKPSSSSNSEPNENKFDILPYDSEDMLNLKTSIRDTVREFKERIRKKAKRCNHPYAFGMFDQLRWSDALMLPNLRTQMGAGRFVEQWSTLP